MPRLSRRVTIGVIWGFVLLITLTSRLTVDYVSRNILGQAVDCSSNSSDPGCLCDNTGTQFCGNGGIQCCDGFTCSDPDPQTNEQYCQPNGPVCLNGIPEAGEECDDGNNDNNDECTNACLNAACGDTFQQGVEGCDDGNLVDGDGCSATCTIEVNNCDNPGPLPPYAGAEGDVFGGDPHANPDQCRMAGGEQWADGCATACRCPAGEEFFNGRCVAGCGEEACMPPIRCAAIEWSCDNGPGYPMPPRPPHATPGGSCAAIDQYVDAQQDACEAGCAGACVIQFTGNGVACDDAQCRDEKIWVCGTCFAIATPCAAGCPNCCDGGVAPAGDAEMVKTPPPSIIPGQPATYSFVVTNTSDEVAPNVNFYDYFLNSEGLQYFPFTLAGSTGASCGIDTDYPGFTQYHCGLGDMQPGEVRNITLTFNVPEDIGCDAEFTNRADVWTNGIPSTGTFDTAEGVPVECPTSSASSIDSSVSSVQSSEVSSVVESSVASSVQSSVASSVDSSADSSILSSQASSASSDTTGPNACEECAGWCVTGLCSEETCEASGFCLWEDIFGPFNYCQANPDPLICPNDGGSSSSMSSSAQSSSLISSSVQSSTPSIASSVASSAASSIASSSVTSSISSTNSEYPTSVKITKTGPATVNPGEEITYVVTVENTGPVTALNLEVEDLIGPRVAFLGATYGCTARQNVVTCNGFNLAPGAMKSFYIRYLVDSITFCTNTGNSAKVYASNAAPDADQILTLINTNCGSSTSSSANSSAASFATTLNLRKTGPSLVLPNSNAIYTLTVENTGNAMATDVRIEDLIGANLIFVSASPGCLPFRDVVVCNGFDLPANTSRSFTLNLYVTNVNYCTHVGNSAEVFAGNADSDADQAITLVNSNCSGTQSSASSVVVSSTPIVVSSIPASSVAPIQTGYCCMNNVCVGPSTSCGLSLNSCIATCGLSSSRSVVASSLRSSSRQSISVAFSRPSSVATIASSSRPRSSSITIAISSSRRSSVSSTIVAVTQSSSVFACRTDLECAVGSRCVAGRCVACTDSACMRCTQNNQCASNLCLNGTCVACTSGNQCASGQCIAGKCTECTTDSQCAAGNRCISGSCVACLDGMCTRCTENIQCASNLCLNGICTACTSGNQCVSGLCTNGKCVECTTDNQCPGNKRCEAGQCVAAVQIAQAPLFCGNGQLNAGEECDDGKNNSNKPNAACRVDCQTAGCGDGVLDAPKEFCDDGNTQNNDGCSAACTIERSAAGVMPGQVIEFPVGANAGTTQGSPIEIPVIGSNTSVPPSAADTGPAAVAVMAAGAAAGYAFMRRRRR